MQGEITGRLARSLDLELTNIESERGQRERPADPDAVDLTLRGWAALNRPETRESFKRAVRFFEQALTIDPRRVDALVGLGDALTLNVIEPIRPQSRRDTPSGRCGNRVGDCRRPARCAGPLGQR